MRLLDGRSMAAEIGRYVIDEAERLMVAGHTPTLAVVLPGTDPAARSYTHIIERTAGKVGVRCEARQPAGGPAALLDLVDALAADPLVDGIIVQTPLPAGLSSREVGEHIPVEKDVDGMNPASLGRLALGLPGFAPATAAAVVEILTRAAIPMAGVRVCVIGRGPVVGKPVSLLLLAEDATVTICHSRTADLVTVAHEADIIVAATGRPGLVGAGFVRPGATVVDVGTAVTAAGQVGDVDVAAIAPVAGALTPVPGGVGPVTTMLLLRNTVRAAERR
ncbi:bifunctional 5,10-methylenetetrahydrofolate dehydrogenase/5,10-methenyltetrahydrofolate cyclohydrolase [Frankia sp. AgB32]|uniref:bifunctional 5,10-methylenetetrahydrofolate dehydrogenase/5,10-methenyltetrahydrofolate cyclohydrolase n=1 Tax=Frankia sp. AgB32 TaxID=631119 RepID=UPI00200C83B2|nr:bifunctional 5,10-methylenetetrahydrofolate dehydrogenase/5,10-methenyltetrahydrofolate cyclohydrolase [Frankia sp. AgB32]MCK9896426.1 bifunctional 5,10-methylenetetrahydrofolate dehydrogenase/5,10-methenyltetrahydrofolate cyclohydrolase [Frankia sp. AgB32]